MVHFVGAGSGAPDLITVRGQRLIAEADVIIYAGSLVNRALLDGRREGCRVYDSAKMTLEEVADVMRRADKENLTIVRLHTGDPSLYGAVREQMDILEREGIPYDVTPGVSSLCGAASALKIYEPGLTILNHYVTCLEIAVHERIVWGIGQQDRGQTLKIIFQTGLMELHACCLKE